MATALAKSEPRAPHVPEEVKANVGYDPMADRRLWCSVILQAVQDAQIDAHDAEWTTPQRDAHDAIKWLLFFNDEAVKVCSLAGANWERVRRSTCKVLAPLAEAYGEKARLCYLQAESMTGDAAKTARKKGERYRTSATLIRDGIASRPTPV